MEDARSDVPEDAAAAQEAALEAVADTKHAGVWWFWLTAVLLLSASAFWIASKNGWAAPDQLSKWIDAVVAAIASVASAAAISLTVKLRVSKTALTQVVQANTQLDQQLHDASVKQHTEHSHNYTENHTTHHSAAGLDAENAAKLTNVVEQLHKLEGMMAPQRANPEHVRQLNDFIERARTSRVLELEAQLADDVKIFDRIRELLTTLVSECERARIASASKRSA